MKKPKKRKFLNKKSLIIFIILLVLILALITIVLFSKKPKIIETKTFSEIKGFTFDYPIFKGWEVSLIKKINENEYQIFFKCPFETVVTPWMSVKKNFDPRMYNIPSLPYTINPNKIRYYLIESSEGSHIIFFRNTQDFVIEIYPFIHEGDGYSEKAFIKKIIETFKFN